MRLEPARSVPRKVPAENTVWPTLHCSTRRLRRTVSRPSADLGGHARGSRRKLPPLPRSAAARHRLLERRGRPRSSGSVRIFERGLLGERLSAVGNPPTYSASLSGRSAPRRRGLWHHPLHRERGSPRRGTPWRLVCPGRHRGALPGWFGVVPIDVRCQRAVGEKSAHAVAQPSDSPGASLFGRLEDQRQSWACPVAD
jgi:hypothetical protein